MGPSLGKLLIVAGLVLLALGVTLLFSDRLPLGRLGRLPGDLVYKRGTFTAYFPFATSILISLLLTLLLWFINRK
jgi:hypothetical protein